MDLSNNMESPSIAHATSIDLLVFSACLAPGSILYYDHLLTLGSEISCIWTRPKTASAYWFFLHRYLAFFSILPVSILQFVALGRKVSFSRYSGGPALQCILPSCEQYYLSRQLLLVVTQVLICVLLTMRTYALHCRSRRILAFMLGGAAILSGFVAWSLVGQHSTVAEHVSGCHVELSLKTGIHLAVAWEGLFMYDTLLFALTLFKAYKVNHQHPITQPSIPIVTLILRDGAIYFVVMALANLSNILTFYISKPVLKGSLSTVASAISVTMVSRLMLNLHETADAGVLTEGSKRTDYMFTSQYTTTTIGSELEGIHDVLVDDDIEHQSEV